MRTVFRILSVAVGDLELGLEALVRSV